MLKKNDDIILDIESISSEGSGVGHCDGMTVFVDGGIPGDKLLVHIIKVKKTYSIAIIKNIVSASVHRIEVDCPVFSKCGGCSFRMMDYSAELEMKKKVVNDALQRLGGLDISVDEIICSESTDHYRNKGIYQVSFGDDLKTNVGFYSKRSHRVVDCRNCRLAPTEFGQIIDAVVKWASGFGVSLYDETTGRGLLRRVFLRKAFKTDQIMLCLVINGDIIPRGDALIEYVIEACENVKSIVLNINTDNTNVALGKKCITIFGSDSIEDILCSRRFKISPLSFFQINPECCELLYKKVGEYASLQKDETLLDLFCGTGTIGLTLARNCKKLIGIEIIPDAVKNAEENAFLNKIENAEFLCGDAEEAAKMFFENGLDPDCVIIDPPRKGCTQDTIETVAEMRPKRVVYVSCDPATLARDCGRFSKLGYDTVKAAAVDMFPRTRHVETVTLITRAGS